MVTDFEDGLLRATSAVFGRQVDHQGCFYHLTQATWRRIQKHRLATHYMTDPEFRQFCNTLDALAFLPTADLQEGIAYIRSITPDEPVASEDLVDYFDTTYICKWYLPSSPAAESRPTSTTDNAPCSTYVPAFSLECPQCYNGGQPKNQQRL